MLRRACAERGREILRESCPKKDVVFLGMGAKLLTPKKHQGQMLSEKLERWSNAAQSHDRSRQGTGRHQYDSFRHKNTRQMRINDQMREKAQKRG